jgi:hypothetical protein
LRGPNLPLFLATNEVSSEESKNYGCFGTCWRFCFMGPY